MLSQQARRVWGPQGRHLLVPLVAELLALQMREELRGEAYLVREQRLRELRGEACPVREQRLRELRGEACPVLGWHRVWLQVAGHRERFLQVLAAVERPVRQFQEGVPGAVAHPEPLLLVGVEHPEEERTRPVQQAGAQPVDRWRRVEWVWDLVCST